MSWLRGTWRRLTLPPQFVGEQLRIDRALVGALALGSAALAVLGLVELAYVPFPISIIQPIGAIAASVWAIRMLRANRPKPLLILSLGLALSVIFVVVEYLVPSEPGELGRISTAAIVVATGVVAMTARRRRRSGMIWLGALLIVGTLTSLSLGFGFVSSVSDGLVAMTVTAIAMYMVAINRQMVTAVDERYGRLADAMVLAVSEVDLGAMRRLLHAEGVTVETLHRLIDERLLRTRAALSARLLSSNDAALALAPAESVEEGERVMQAMLRSRRHDEMLLKLADTALTGSPAEHVIVMPDSRAFLMRYIPDPVRPWRLTLLGIEISAQRQAEMALEEEIRSKDQFIASVSHELRTPLTAVLGLTEELRDRTSNLTEQERKELMDIVAEQTRDISAIVEDLLVAARAEVDEITIEAAVVDLVPLLGQTVERLEMQIEADLPADLLAIGDSARIRQIARNLLTNADRYGGTAVRLLGGRHDGSVWLEVRDNGDAIPEDRRDLIFAAYQRAHEPIRGTPQSVGLGLTVSKTLSELMNGDLSYNHDGSETVFRLTLPAG